VNEPSPSKSKDKDMPIAILGRFGGPDSLSIRRSNPWTRGPYRVEAGGPKEEESILWGMTKISAFTRLFREHEKGNCWGGGKAGRIMGGRENLVRDVSKNEKDRDGLVEKEDRSS